MDLLPCPRTPLLHPQRIGLKTSGRDGPIVNHLMLDPHRFYHTSFRLGDFPCRGIGIEWRIAGDQRTIKANPFNHSIHHLLLLLSFLNGFLSLDDVFQFNFPPFFGVREFTSFQLIQLGCGGVVKMGQFNELQGFDKESRILCPTLPTS
jgi:hypothetical protein